MLNNISWAEYITATGAAVILFYLYVFLRYGRRGRPTEKAVEQGPGESGQAIPEPYYVDGQEYEEISDEQYGQANDLMEKLSSCIQEAVASGTDKEGIKVLLSNLLSFYPAVNIPFFRKGVSERIITELNELDSVSLTEREVEGLW